MQVDPFSQAAVYILAPVKYSQTQLFYCVFDFNASLMASCATPHLPGCKEPLLSCSGTHQWSKTQTAPGRRKLGGNYVTQKRETGNISFQSRSFFTFFKPVQRAFCLNTKPEKTPWMLPHFQPQTAFPILTRTGHFLCGFNVP